MEHLKVCKQQVRGVNPNVRVLFFQFVLPVHHGYNGLTQLHCRRDTAVRFLHRNCFQCITDTQRLHTVICINSYHTAFKCRNNSIPHAALAVLMWDFCSVTKMNCFDKIRFNFLFFFIQLTGVIQNEIHRTHREQHFYCHNKTYFCGSY